MAATASTAAAPAKSTCEICFGKGGVHTKHCHAASENAVTGERKRGREKNSLFLYDEDNWTAWLEEAEPPPAAPQTKKRGASAEDEDYEDDLGLLLPLPRRARKQPDSAPSSSSSAAPPPPDEEVEN